MNTAAAAPGRFEAAAKSDDRWFLSLPRRGLTAPSSSIALASIAVHAVLVMAAVATSRPTDVPRPQEIAVEIVKDVPKPPPVKAPEVPKPQKAAEAPKTQEAPKAQKAKEAPKPPEAAKPPARQEATKTERAKPPPSPPQRKAPDDLRRQLDELKAERAALEAQRQAAAKAARESRPPADPIAQKYQNLLGSPMPGMAAIALPGTSALGSESVSYTQLVLSKLAKAKKEGRYRGIPGAATVAFVVGDAGEVASVDVARKSVDPELDEEAIDMVKRAAPFPPPPVGGKRDYVITLRFQAIP